MQLVFDPMNPISLISHVLIVFPLTACRERKVASLVLAIGEGSYKESCDNEENGQFDCLVIPTLNFDQL